MHNPSLLESKLGELLVQRGLKTDHNDPKVARVTTLVSEAFPDNRYKCIGVVGRWALLQTKDGGYELPSLKVIRRAKLRVQRPELNGG
mgnify:CR=1 FL=1